MGRTFDYLQLFGSQEPSGVSDTSSSSSSIEFDFLDVGDAENFHENPTASESYQYQQEFLDEEEERSLKGSGGIVEESRKFWETQHQLLQANLRRSSSVESKLRNLTKEALKMVDNRACACGTTKPLGVAGCRSCLMREVSSYLRSAGFDCGICKCRWRSTPLTSSGEHAFLDVLYTSRSKKGEVTRVILDMAFRAEFEVARASDEYVQLLQKLPKIFVGKPERLTAVIKILCRAAKRCMKEKDMHMGPWRKLEYMQAKWFGPNCERSADDHCPQLDSYWQEKVYTGRRETSKASMLTLDLLEKLPDSYVNAVQVA